MKQRPCQRKLFIFRVADKQGLGAISWTGQMSSTWRGKLLTELCAVVTWRNLCSIKTRQELLPMSFLNPSTVRTLEINIVI